MEHHHEGLRKNRSEAQGLNATGNEGERPQQRKGEAKPLAWARYLTARQEEGETAAPWGNRIKRLATAVKPDVRDTDELLCRRFIDGLRERHTQKDVRAQRPSSLLAAAIAVFREETARRSAAKLTRQHAALMATLQQRVDEPVDHFYHRVRQALDQRDRGTPDSVQRTGAWRRQYDRDLLAFFGGGLVPRLRSLVHCLTTPPPESPGALRERAIAIEERLQPERRATRHGWTLPGTRPITSTPLPGTAPATSTGGELPAKESNPVPRPQQERKPTRHGWILLDTRPTTSTPLPGAAPTPFTEDGLLAEEAQPAPTPARRGPPPARRGPHWSWWESPNRPAPTRSHRWIFHNNGQNRWIFHNNGQNTNGSCNTDSGW